MAGRAVRVGPVLLEDLSQGQVRRPAACRLVGQGRHAGRRGVRRVVEDDTREPGSARDGLRSQRVRRHCHDRRGGDHATLAAVGDGDPAKRDRCRRHFRRTGAVAVPRVQQLAAVAVVGVDQFQDRAVLDQNGLEQQQGLQHHVHAGPELCEVKVRVPLAVGHRGHDAFELQPLRGKAVAESLQTGVLQHALDLRPQHSGVAQGALGGQVEQGLVRNAAPQEKRQARRELEIVKLPGCLAGAGPLVKVEEARRRQSGRDSRLHAVGVGLSGFHPRSDVAGIALEEGVVNRPSKRPREEVAQGRFGHSAVGFRFRRRRE